MATAARPDAVAPCGGRPSLGARGPRAVDRLAGAARRPATPVLLSHRLRSSSEASGRAGGVWWSATGWGAGEGFAFRTRQGGRERGRSVSPDGAAKGDRAGMGGGETAMPFGAPIGAPHGVPGNGLELERARGGRVPAAPRLPWTLPRPLPLDGAPRSAPALGKGARRGGSGSGAAAPAFELFMPAFGAPVPAEGAAEPGAPTPMPGSGHGDGHGNGTGNGHGHGHGLGPCRASPSAPAVGFPAAPSFVPVRCMRHGRRVRKLNRPADQRRAMLRALTTQVLTNGRATTTRARAKELRRRVDRIVTLSKRGGQHSYRLALRYVYDKHVLRELFRWAPHRYRKRAGGYSRLVRVAGTRRGDNAELAGVELCD